METTNFLLKTLKGKRTELNRAYYNHINIILQNLDEETEERWETYNAVIQELINQGKRDYFNEIKYRLTDGEDPNDVMLDIIEREVDNTSGLIWYLKRKIEEYKEEDFLKRFSL